MMILIREMKDVRLSSKWSPFTDDKGFSDLRSSTKDASLTIPFTFSVLSEHFF